MCYNIYYEKKEKKKKSLLLAWSVMLGIYIYIYHFSFSIWPWYVKDNYSVSINLSYSMCSNIYHEKKKKTLYY